MKVSIGFKLRDTAWGGGNQFAQALSKYLESRGDHVFSDLKPRDLDIILLTDPRPDSQSASFQVKQIARYLLAKNKRAIIIHRINECDERKGTEHVNAALMEANQIADHTIYISAWLRDLFIGHGYNRPATSVLRNGADADIFNAQGYTPWDGTSKVKLITHHWGGNWFKGFDIYQRLDEMLAEPAYKDKLDFTYIGRVPQGFEFKHATLLEPLSGLALAEAIKSNHVYVTGSLNEPGGMHHIEGAMCGLPLLYIESGALPEHGEGFGIPFTLENFEAKLNQMLASYPTWASKMKDYPNSAEHMCAQYYQLFEDLLARREEVLKNREFTNSPRWLLKQSF